MLIGKKSKRFLALSGIFFLILICFEWRIDAKETAYEDFTNLNLIRFHIRAQSNTKEDQEIKMAVREQVLIYLQKNLKQVKDKSEVRKQVLEHRPQIEQVIKQELRSYHQNPVISIYFTKEFFPMRKYGQTIVPAGIYEALRIDLGKARGRNWWCVLYPGLCLIDSDHVLENPEEKEELEQMLNEGSVKMKYKSYILKFFQSKRKALR